MQTKVRRHDPVWIPLADGCRLAATLWLPENADRTPVPAILEYLPYRRRDGTALRDASLHPPMAAYGYACLRVDLRGTGDSDGLLHDEYLPQEQADALEVIAWIAAQPWCSGAVGMLGISWGGFNALQVAALRPPALRAIITLCSTDDRYADDTHYMGGSLLTGNLTWGSVMLATSTLPPDPQVVGDRWRTMWLHRLAHQPLLAAIWTEHQHRDAYWRQGSVCEDYAAIACPVLAIGGWADAYVNAVGRLLAGLQVPRRGLIGPWSHAYPHLAQPGPAIDFIAEAVRWWNLWLKGRPNGAMEGPMLRAWLQDSTPPAARTSCAPGRWVAEPVWPPAEKRDLVLHLGPGTLSLEPPRQTFDLVVASPQDTGIASGAWCGYGLGDAPTDQRVDDERSVVFTTPPLHDALAFLGTPVLDLEFTANPSVGTLAVRLLDLAPDGASTRVSYALLAISRRCGPIRLNDAGWRFHPGHRIGLAVSSAYWPTAWPGPAPLAITVTGGRLHLPERPDRPDDAALPPFDPPPHDVATVRHHTDRAPDRSRAVTLDAKTGATTLHSRKDRGATCFSEIGLQVDARGEERFSIHPAEPLSGRVETHWECAMRRGAWSMSSRSEVTMTVDAGSFHIAASVVVRENEAVVSDRSWSVAIPRDGI